MRHFGLLDMKKIDYEMRFPADKESAACHGLLKSRKITYVSMSVFRELDREKGQFFF